MRVSSYIDIHFHADARADGGGDLRAVSEWMGANSVDRLIVLPLERMLPENEDERQRMIDNFNSYAGRIYRFCVAFPEDLSSHEDVVGLLRKEKDAGAIGFGEHYGRGLNFDDPRCMQLYAASAEVGLPVLFHMDGECNKDGPGFARLENALSTHRECVFIGHGPGFWSKVKAADRLMSRFRNLYADISAGSGARGIGSDVNYGREFIVRHSDRVLFGTDGGPWSLGKKEAAPQFELVERLGLPPAAKERLCRVNAEELFDLEKDPC